MELTDKEIEEFSDIMNKDITQEDSIAPEVEQELGEIGWLWDRVKSKFKEDNVCYVCKKKMKVEEDDKPELRVLEASSQPAVISFVCICTECYDKELEKQINLEKVEK